MLIRDSCSIFCAIVREMSPIFFVIFLLKLVQVKASVGYFWHVSDFHLDPRYGSNLTEDRSLRDIFLGDYDEGCWTERRNPLGDYNCDSPLALVQELSLLFFRKCYHLAKKLIFNQTKHIIYKEEKIRKEMKLSVGDRIYEKCH